MENDRVCIGIPCFHSVTHEVLEDYMRFAYHLGRRNQGYDFFLAIKPKSAQHRARNAIVQAAIATNCQWLFMLDDDHIIDTEKTVGPGDQYDIASKLIQHLKGDPKKGIVGGLYFQRGATCDPVIMYRNPPGYTFYQIQDISRRLQKVDVTGGGCMMIRMDVFDKIDSPWFMDEMAVSAGTDIQICEKVAKAGWEIWCDTSIEIGHIMTEREVVTSKNAHKIRYEASEWMNREDIKNAPRFKTVNFIDEYVKDALEFTGKTPEDLIEMREAYSHRTLTEFDTDHLQEYYSGAGELQIARNVTYHMMDHMRDEAEFLLSMFNRNLVSKGLDWGCGTAPVGFELSKRGNTVDFIDVPGGAAQKFIKFRADKYGIENYSFKMGNGYDWILFLDSIEHMHPANAVETIKDIVSRLKPGGSVVTNYFYNRDFDNLEHIFMQHEKVKALFEEIGLTMVPIVSNGKVVKNLRWVKA